MTPAECKRCIRVLVRARQEIAQKRFAYLCTALDYIGQTMPELIYSVDTCKLWIRQMLSGNISLQMWLNKHHAPYAEELDRIKRIPVGPEFDKAAAERTDRLRATRLAWIDWMIRELRR